MTDTQGGIGWADPRMDVLSSKWVDDPQHIKKFCEGASWSVVGWTDAARAVFRNGDIVELSAKELYDLEIKSDDQSRNGYVILKACYMKLMKQRDVWSGYKKYWASAAN